VSYEHKKNFCGYVCTLRTGVLCSQNPDEYRGFQPSPTITNYHQLSATIANSEALSGEGKTMSEANAQFDLSKISLSEIGREF
jgi:hypothetical protein